GVPRVAALLDQILRRRPLDADLHELGLIRVVLAEMGAQAALSVMNAEHGCSLLYVAGTPSFCVSGSGRRVRNRLNHQLRAGFSWEILFGICKDRARAMENSNNF